MFSNLLEVFRGGAGIGFLSYMVGFYVWLIFTFMYGWVLQDAFSRLEWYVWSTSWRSSGVARALGSMTRRSRKGVSSASIRIPCERERERKLYIETFITAYSPL